MSTANWYHHIFIFGAFDLSLCR